MPLDPLLGPDGPWLRLLVTTESDACDLLEGLVRAQGPRLAVRRVRGNKARTTQGWFDECAAAFQFPSYFGENWNAFDECITDLEWLPADAYVLLITNSGRLLEAETPQTLALLFTALENAGREWGKAVVGQFPRPPKAFHVIIQCGRAEEGSLREKLEAAKVSWLPYRHAQQRA
jgi:Barstar (barnase inhibitor)